MPSKQLTTCLALDTSVTMWLLVLCLALFLGKTGESLGVVQEGTETPALVLASLSQVLPFCPAPSLISPAHSPPGPGCRDLLSLPAFHMAKGLLVRLPT